MRRLSKFRPSKSSKSQHFTNKKSRLKLESLEPRTMMSASSGASSIVAQPNVHVLTASAFSTYSPAQIRAAYGINQLSLTGAGQTIAIVDAYNDPTIAADLAKFDTQFGLPAAQLTVAEQYNGTTPPAYNAGWATEIALDVEWAHAIAPGAKILLVEANSSSLNSLLAGVNYARTQPGVSVVSMSWGAADFNGEGTFDSYFTTPAGHTGVTFVASSGDSGAGASWPAISSNVIAVGGTSLTLNANGTYGSETAWSGSGGGYSLYETESTYQRSVQSTGKESDPTVAYDASPTTGFYVYDSSSGHGSWYAVGGTSAGSPQWAGLFALANQGRAQAGKAALNNAMQAIYSLPATDFHDITTGSNGNAAKVGYDVVTGRGSPIANLLVPGLINATNPTTPAVAAAGTTSITGTFKSMASGVGQTPPLSPVLSEGQNVSRQTSNTSSNGAGNTYSAATPSASTTALVSMTQVHDDDAGVSRLTFSSDANDEASRVDGPSWQLASESGSLVGGMANEQQSFFGGFFEDEDSAAASDSVRAYAADHLVDSFVAGAGSASESE
jgi:subtilase family serine protease